MSSRSRTTTNDDLLPAGTLLLTEKPFVYILHAKYRQTHCDHCFAESDTLIGCPECQYVRYCDRGCLRDALKVHKPSECRYMKLFATRAVPDVARTLARLISKLNNGGEYEKSYYAPRLYRRWRDLMTHYDEMKVDPVRVQHIASIAHTLAHMQMLPGDAVLPNDVELMQLYGRLKINSFNIADHLTNRIGTGIYLAVSVTNHSCRPNAVVTFDGIRLNMRSLEPMRPPGDFRHVSISYIEYMEPFRHRQEVLRANYYFTCECARCADADEAAAMSAAACPNAECDAPLDLCATDEESPARRCARCDAMITDEHCRRFADVMELTGRHLREMDAQCYLDVCELLLARQAGVLHPFNAYHLKVLDHAFEAAAYLGRAEQAADYGRRLIAGWQRYNASNYLLGIQKIQLAEQLIKMQRLTEARDALRGAEDILQYSFGKNERNRAMIRSMLKQTENETMTV